MKVNVLIRYYSHVDGSNQKANDTMSHLDIEHCLEHWFAKYPSAEIVITKAKE